MKKIMAFFFFVVACFGFTACASPSEKELKKASKNLSCYAMDIEYDENHSISVRQDVNYVNSSDINMDKIFLIICILFTTQ